MSGRPTRSRAQSESPPAITVLLTVASMHLGTGINELNPTQHAQWSSRHSDPEQTHLTCLALQDRMCNSSHAFYQVPDTGRIGEQCRRVEVKTCDVFICAAKWR